MYTCHGGLSGDGSIAALLRVVKSGRRELSMIILAVMLRWMM